jgi:hypothetical protein
VGGAEGPGPGPEEVVPIGLVVVVEATVVEALAADDGWAVEEGPGDDPCAAAGAAPAIVAGTAPSIEISAALAARALSERRCISAVLGRGADRSPRRRLRGGPAPSLSDGELDIAQGSRIMERRLIRSNAA